MNGPRGSSSRPPFDPGRARGAADQGTLFSPTQPGERSGKQQANGPTTLTVSQLTRLVKGAINREFPNDIRVVGELSNLSRPAGGHLYFTLKDPSSEVRCVLWRSSAGSLKFTPVDGLEVVATGSLDVYEPRGQYQFYVRRMEPRGVGALEVAFRRLKERLEKEGLFDPARKRPIPRFARCVAVVTSETGAAIRDILQTISRRFPCLRVLVYGVRVQGDGAAEEIADAIRRINAARDRLGVDVLIVGRGGGSLEDLWAFNEEAVARAIYASEIPVVSAVGHEVDFTIADFTADVRAATPTAAAELVVPDRAELAADVEAQARRLRRGVARMLESARSRLTVIERYEWFRDPVGQVRRRGQEIDEVTSRLRLVIAGAVASRRSTLHDAEVRLSRVRPEAVLAKRRELLSRTEHRLRWAQGHFSLIAERRLRGMHARLMSASPEARVGQAAVLVKQLTERLAIGIARTLSDRRLALATLDARLLASGHENILRRGFTITRRKRGGKIVRASSDVKTGDRLETQTADGRIASRVLDGEQGELFE
ncbi:MAG: exodeoxyribonuclease VII large subunit [Planctomycetota bacterium]